MVTLERTAKDHALLILDNGEALDVYADNWGLIQDEAEALARYLGVSIDTMNPELPE